jgi:hypothetical protein
MLQVEPVVETMFRDLQESVGHVPVVRERMEQMELVLEAALHTLAAVVVREGDRARLAEEHAQQIMELMPLRIQVLVVLVQ